jgi:hypothetical protein
MSPPSLPRLLLVLAGLSPAVPAVATPLRPADVAGTYRASGTARVLDTGVVDQEVDLRADVILSPGPPPRGVVARLSSQGHACVVEGELGPGGALTFAPGQPCALAVQGAGLRGRFQARLTSARGEVRGGQLALTLAGELTGTVQLATQALQVLGVDVPQGWSPEAPVRGRVEAEAAGRRDQSRGAAPPAR